MSLTNSLCRGYDVNTTNGNVLGGSNDVSKMTKGQFLDMLSADPIMRDFRGFMASLPLSVKELERFRVTVLRDPESFLYKNAHDDVIGRIQVGNAGKVLQQQAVIRTYLTAEQKSIVSESRPHLNIKYLDKELMGHGMAHAQRTLDCVEQMRMVPAGESVLEIGGNLVTTILKGLDNWTVTAPRINFRDGVRGSSYKAFSRRVLSGVVKLSDRAQIVWNKWNEDNDSVCLFQRAEDVCKKFDWVYAQHSLYDVGLDNLMKIMHNTSAKGCYGSLIMNVNTLNEIKGELPALGGYFERCDKDNTSISFGFHGDPSMMYTHEFDKYKEYYNDKLISYKGIDYLYKVYDRSADTVKYMCMRLGDAVKHKTFTNPVYVKTGLSGWLRIKAPIVNVDTPVTSLRHVRHIEYVVPGATFWAALERLKVEGGKWERSHIYNYVRSQDVRLVINNVCVKATDKIPTDVFSHLVSVLHVLSEYEIAEERTNIKEVSAAMQDRRFGGSEKGFFAGVWRSFVRSVGNGFSGLRNDIRESLLLKVKALGDIPTITACSDLELFSERVGQAYTSGRGCETVVPEAFEDLDNDETRARLINEALLDEELSEEEKEELRSYLDTPDDSSSDSEVDLSCVSSGGSEISTALTDFDASKPEILDDGDYLAGVEYDGEVVLAIQEYSNIQKYLHDEVVGEVKYFWNQTSNLDRSPGKNISDCRRPNKKKAGDLSVDELTHNYLFVVDGIVSHALLPKVGTADDYSCVIRFDNNKRVSIINKSGVAYVDVPNGWYYVNDNLKVFNAQGLNNAAMSVLLDPSLIKLPKNVTMVDGVPGCGKTTYICDELFECYDSGIYNFVVLVASKKSCVDTKDRLLYGREHDKLWCAEISKRVRTLDSFLLRPFKDSPDILFIDEGRMAHSGQLLMVMSMLTPRRVKVLGDPQQVPYVNFSKVSMLYRDFTMWNDIETKFDTYRLSVKAAACVLHMYEGKLRVKGVKNNGSPYMGELSVVKINSINDIPKEDVMHSCFMQAEKETLLKGKYCKNHSRSSEHSCKVKTVVEIQGSDTDNLSIVRFESRVLKDSIYSEAKRVNSVLTRSCNKVTYYTACDTDMLATWIRVGCTYENMARVRGEYDGFDDDGKFVYNLKKPYVAPKFSQLASAAGFVSSVY